MALKVTISGNDTVVYTIDTLEELNNIHGILNNKFFAQVTSRETVIEEYFRDTPPEQIYDNLSDNNMLLDYIIDAAVSNETEYSTFGELVRVLDGMVSALDTIYNEAREYI